MKTSLRVLIILIFRCWFSECWQLKDQNQCTNDIETKFDELKCIGEIRKEVGSSSVATDKLKKALSDQSTCLPPLAVSKLEKAWLKPGQFCKQIDTMMDEVQDDCRDGNQIGKPQQLIDMVMLQVAQGRSFLEPCDVVGALELLRNFDYMSITNAMDYLWIEVWMLIGKPWPDIGLAICAKDVLQNCHYDEMRCFQKYIEGIKRAKPRASYNTTVEDLMENIGPSCLAADAAILQEVGAREFRHLLKRTGVENYDRVTVTGLSELASFLHEIVFSLAFPSSDPAYVVDTCYLDYYLEIYLQFQKFPYESFKEYRSSIMETIKKISDGGKL